MVVSLALTFLAFALLALGSERIHIHRSADVALGVGVPAAVVVHNVLPDLGIGSGLGSVETKMLL